MILIDKYRNKININCYIKMIIIISKFYIIIIVNIVIGQNKKKSKLITKANWDILLKRRELDDRERFRGAMSWSHNCKVNNLYFIILS